MDALHLPDGLLFDQWTGMFRVVIRKQHHQITLAFANRESGEEEGLMSRMDVRQPLDLLAPYTQALMLSWVWHPTPSRIAIVGMAGGRLSRVWYTMLPAVIIDNVDIDPIMAELATRYFGVVFDQRQRFIAADGLTFLEASRDQYDLILMDAFSDASDTLDHLATSQFYHHGLARLTHDGVFAANLLRSDPQFERKRAVFAQSFPISAMVELKRSLVVFGSRQRLLRPDVVRRAQQLEHQHQLLFPLATHAAHLTKLPPVRSPL